MALAQGAGTFESPRRAEQELAVIAAAAGAQVAASVRERALRSAEPDDVVAAFARIAGELGPNPERALDLLGPVIAGSELFPRLLAGRPGLVRWTTGSRTLLREKPLPVYLAEARGALRGLAQGDTEAFHRRLRRYKYRELLRIGVRELSLRAPLQELGRETAHLAQALISAALSVVEQELTAKHGAPDAPGFAVFGLGKLGGEDLNFSSDVDLVYLYRDGGQTSGGTGPSIPTVQFYTRVAEALTKALSMTGADGFCYRVDLNLRPQGRSGAIVLSLPAMVTYYETYGRTWERAAWLKARCVAGDEALANELLSSIEPFIWRKGTDLGAVDGLREMKAQIDLRGKATTDDVKLGPGGIREVEFFANSLQLLHGGRNPALRERHTLRALRKLERAGLLSGTDADALEEAYLFLRRVENRLQMVAERQTQLLPSSDVERIRLARGLGFRDPAAFDAELKRHRAYVQNAFSTLLGQTARDETAADPQLALALDPDATAEARQAALTSRHFTQPEQAMLAIERLARVPDSPFAIGGGGGPSVQAVRLLTEIARTPDPDQALAHFAEFIGTLRAPQGYLNVLSRMTRVSRRLVNLFGQSDYLTRYFLRHPELLDAMVQGQFDEAAKHSDRIREELSQRASRYPDSEERLGALRRIKNEEALRIGLNDIGGEIDVPDVARQLTAIADGVLDDVLFIAESEMRERYGDPLTGRHPESLSVIGMGKLGGRELGYHSDLDLIFVYSGTGQEETSGGSRGRLTHHEYFAKVAQRLIHYLQMQLREGILYKTDARLRPSGNKGTLVVSQEAFRAHHERLAQLWERQALVKARGAAGDLPYFERLQREVIHPLVYERPLPQDAAAEIDRLRGRMEKEIAQETEERLDAKTGHGGLVDVEFATQYLQLGHGGRHPEVRTTNTLEAISALELRGCITAPDAEVLRQGYLFHRRVENRLRLVHGNSLSHLPTSGRPLALLARRLGYVGRDPGAAFLDEYRAYTRRVRDVYARALRGNRG